MGSSSEEGDDVVKDWGVGLCISCALCSDFLVRRMV